MKNVIIVIALVFAGVSMAACPKAPPNLSPDAQAAYTKGQVIKALDLIRDFAVDTNATAPNIISNATATAIVQWHQTAVTVVNAAGTGWKNVVKTSFDAVITALPAKDAQVLAPYVPMIDALLS